MHLMPAHDEGVKREKGLTHSDLWTGLAFVLSLLLSVGLALQALVGWPLSAVETLDPKSMRAAEGALAKKCRFPGSFGAWRPAEYRGIVTEDGEPLGPRVWTNREVHRLGKGRYRIDGRQLVFSSSDGTDPQTNGRRYEAHLPINLPVWLLPLAVIGTVLLGVHLARRHWSGLNAVSGRILSRWLPGLPAEEEALASPSPILKGWSSAWSAAVALAILVAPSVWLWATFDPFWRDIDALVQVGFYAQHGNIVHFPPLYCWAARIPLYVGTALEWRVLLPVSFMLEPQITEGGVKALILLQHGALILAEFWLIRLLAAGWRSRIALAAAFATFLPTYTFAHCVGSEALATTLQLAGCAACVGALRKRGFSGRSRYLFMLFWLSVAAGLTRHSAVLMAGMPFAIAFAGFLLTIPCQTRRIRMAGYARSLASACLFAATAYFTCSAFGRVACWMADVEYQPDPGVTFFWRMKQMPRESDQAFLARFDRAADYATDPILREGLRQLAGRIRAGEKYGTDTARSVFGAAAASAGSPESYYEVTNQLPGVFYASAGAPFYAGVGRDFLRYFNTYPQQIASQPPATTAYFLEKQNQPVAGRLSALKRFAGSAGKELQNAELLIDRATWIRVPGWVLLIISLLAMGALAIGVFGVPPHVPAAATLFGILAPAFVWALAHAGLTESLPRFILPTHLSLLAAALAGIAFVSQRNRALSAREKRGGVL